jgi:hypothetical protein
MSVPTERELKVTLGLHQEKLKWRKREKVMLKVEKKRKSNA